MSRPMSESAGPACLSISLTSVSAGERRLDAENYLGEGYSWRQRLVSKTHHRFVREMARAWLPTRLKGTLVDRNHGIPFLVASQAFDMRPAVRKWVSKEHTTDWKERIVEEGWILLTRSGDVGDAIIAYAPHSGAIISDDLLRVLPHDPSDRGLLYLFFRSRVGREMCRSTKYGSVVKHLEPDHVQDLPVPVLPDSYKSKAARVVNGIYDKRSRAFRLFQEATREYESGLGLTPPPRRNSVSFSIRASEVFKLGRRLDAYNHNPDAAEAEALIRKSGLTCINLKAATSRIFQVKRFKHIYTGRGIPYVDSEDLFKVHPDLTKYIPENAKKDASDYFVQSGWLLMMCSGHIYALNGSVTLADAWHEEKIVSNHATRIVPSAEHGMPPAGYLIIVLSHPAYGRPLVIRNAYGTAVPEISPDDIARLPIPRLTSNAEERISSLCEQAFALWAEARDAEQAAVEGFEQEVNLLLTRG